MDVQLKYRGLDVTVTPPRGGEIEGRYTVSIGDLVTGHPLVKYVEVQRGFIKRPRKVLRIYWGKDYGKRFNRLLQGAFRKFFKEMEAI